MTTYDESGSLDELKRLARAVIVARQNYLRHDPDGLLSKGPEYDHELLSKVYATTNEFTDKLTHRLNSVETLALVRLLADY